MSLFSRIQRTYLIAGCAALLAAATDTIASAWKISAGAREASLLSLELLLYVLPWYLLIAAVVSAVLGVAAWLRERAEAAGLPVPTRPGVAGEALLSALPVAGLYLWGLYALTLAAATRFHNHELGSLLVVVGAFTGLLVSSTLWLATFAAVRTAKRRIQRPALRFAATWPLALALPVAAAISIARSNWDGFRILGAGMFLGPAVAVAGALAVWRLLRVPGPGRASQLRRASLVATVSSVPVAIALGYLNPDLPLRAMDARLWSRVVVTGVRAATDVDRDGYSSLFGGGDCAPFKRRINPGARDIPGDGVDQNCLGGDALPPGQQSGPTWYDHPPAEGRAKSLVVITVEAVRSDYVSALGYRFPTTPNIDKLAERSVLFKTMYSASSATPLSLASLWSSQTPSHIKPARGERHDVIDPSTPWFPEMLQKAGFSTAAVLVDYLAFDPAGWDMGFNRGFSNYDITTHVDQRGGNFYGFTSAEMVPKMCTWLEAVAGKRFFLWTHLVEPHLKYEAHPKGPRFGDDEVGLYASDLWAADYEIGTLLQCMERLRLMDNTIVVITGDHGESLGEHGARGHYNSVFEPEVRTLGLMYVPGVGRREVKHPAVHEDLAPTLLNLLGVRTGFDTMRGRNLIPAFTGHSIEPVTFFVELEGFRSNARAVALVDFPFKLIHTRGTPNFLLYDVVKDPDERTDLARQQPELFARMKDETIRHLETAVSAK